MQQGTLELVSRAITIDFPIEQVKLAMKEMFDRKPGTYQIRPEDINDIFNTYHFAIVKGLQCGIVDMTLSKVDDTKTTIDCKVSNAYGARASNSILSGLLNDYLNVLAKVLTGDKSDLPKPGDPAAKSGCMVIMAIGISSLLLMAFTLI